MGGVVFLLAASAFVFEPSVGCVGLQDLGQTSADASVNTPDGAIAMEGGIEGGTPDVPLSGETVLVPAGAFTIVWGGIDKEPGATSSTRVHAYSANTNVGFRCAKTKL